MAISEKRYRRSRCVNVMGAPPVAVSLDTARQDLAGSESLEKKQILVSQVDSWFRSDHTHGKEFL